jgi:hypothetical protein
MFLLNVVKCHSATISFDPSMSKARHDIFALVINF